MKCSGAISLKGGVWYGVSQPFRSGFSGAGAPLVSCTVSDIAIVRLVWQFVPKITDPCISSGRAFLGLLSLIAHSFSRTLRPSTGPEHHEPRYRPDRLPPNRL